MKVALVDIQRVIPYARNPRKNEAAVAKVAASHQGVRVAAADRRR